MRFCKRRNFIYSGLEFKTHCFCGSDDPRKISGYFKRSESDCTLPCGGQSRESCGGPWRLSIYKDCSVLQPYPPHCADIDCTTSSNKWCVRCTDSLYYKLIGYNCRDKCSTRNRWCWPGSCGNEIASNCNCMNGFKTVKSELTANCQPIIKPTINYCQITAVAKDGSKSYSNGGAVQCIMQKDFYGRFQVDRFKINFQAVFKVQVTISRPHFISRELFGITDVEISMKKITVSGNQKDLGTTRYKSDSSSRYPQPVYENDNATIFVQESLQNGERICLTFRVQAGGYFVSKDLTTNTERQVPYDKIETSHTLCYIYDNIPPKHCAEDHSCRGEPLILSRRLLSFRNITVQFNGWMDPDMNIGSGIEIYEIAVYEVEHISSAIQGRDNNVIQILNIYPSDNSTSVNVELPPKTPMLYVVLLTVKDKAKNIRRARRIVLYDNSSVIVVSSDDSFNITEVMNHNKSSKLCISWQERFYNNKFVLNNFLAPITPEVASTSVKGIYDQEIGLLLINGTENVNGLTAFYFTFIRNNEQIYTGKLQDISHQSVCLTSEIKHGDIITFHLKIEDIMNHTLNDSVTVYIKHITVTQTKETSHDQIIGIVTGGILSVVIVLLLIIVIVQHKRLTDKKATATSHDRYKETYESPGTKERQSNVYDDVSPEASNSIYESIRLKPKSTIHEIFDKENGGHTSMYVNQEF
ncbi:uncharacterized protein LOC143083108 [Mytilus galloprovincialis]|uniref:uncharacterized protein LOC143083108 n=1 Tax=Mytilus galloprovincialis TaxID=29158 RepID=UPI003F7BA9E8